jgi:hypothetical protein
MKLREHTAENITAQTPIPRVIAKYWVRTSKGFPFVSYSLLFSSLRVENRLYAISSTGLNINRVAIEIRLDIRPNSAAC